MLILAGSFLLSFISNICRSGKEHIGRRIQGSLAGILNYPNDKAHPYYLHS